MIIIDGLKIADERLVKLKNKILSFDTKPKFAIILVGENSASLIYVKHKIKKASEIGIDVDLMRFNSDVLEIDLINSIQQLNNRKDINGIIVQLPIPEHIDILNLSCAVDPKKDVDGFNPMNVGKLSVLGSKTDGMIPCTPLGCLELIKSVDDDLVGKNVVIIGRSNIVGKPLSYLLTHENATVTLAHSKTKDIRAITNSADIAVTAVGRQMLFDKSYFNKNAIVIDVGISRLDSGKICGDVDFESVRDNIAAITPVPGGVGPMTICCLLENVIKSFECRLYS